MNIIKSISKRWLKMIHVNKSFGRGSLITFPMESYVRDLASPWKNFTS